MLYWTDIHTRLLLSYFAIIVLSMMMGYILRWLHVAIREDRKDSETIIYEEDEE